MAERDPNVVEEFKRRQKRQLVVTLPLVVLVFAILVLGDRGISLGGVSCSAIARPAFVVLIGLILFSLQNWRCPACNGYLGKVISPRFCSKCGAALQ